ncbi:hypothetical protein CC80DRAFT_423005 [Byssothecium circinans]|uniref:Cora-domain-containing protein n=1 Tax=Byssothecium circinans TaxID=147558 RepID=A0A6A5THZ1_9PLEO|nr:hypothetical protein CC80DRAFT_423005 [Byssothecium circinans]
MLIIEDLTPDVIELLGSTLDIDPLLFALHLHTTQRNDSRSQSPVDATLPSRLVSQSYITTTYHQPLTCDKKPSDGWKFERDMAIDRKLVFIRSTSIGLAQHCVSVVKVQQSQDFWIALLLVDPPISDIYYPSGTKEKNVPGIRLTLRPFRGAHEDFLDAPKFSSDWTSLDEIPRRGMALEVVQYWGRHIPQCFDAKNPTLESLAYYPLKMVAASWMKYVAVMQYCMKMYEYQGDKLPNLEQFNTDLRELQGWRRRSMVSQHKVRSIIRQLKARSSQDVGKSHPDIRHLIEDFKVLCNNIEDTGKRLENMLPVVTSLVQIIDARQSFAETTNISRLTILALIFVPLSFVSSLFSMNDNNAPGAPGFWVYFAVAIPITFVVYLVARPPIQVLKKSLDWIRGPDKRKFTVSRQLTNSKDKGTAEP